MFERKTVLVLACFLTAVLLLSAAAANASATGADGAVQQEHVRIITLGGGRYRVIIAAQPGDTYNKPPVIDTFVDSAAPKTSFCKEDDLQVQYLKDEFGDHVQRAFLGFDLSSIPSKATVRTASLHIFLNDAWGANTVPLKLGRVTSSWKCPLGWPGPQSSTVTSVTVGPKPGWQSWNVIKLVDGNWLGKDFGLAPNYGLEIRGPDSGGQQTYFYRYFNSSNAASNRPYLVVEYDLPTPIPPRTPTPSPTRTPTPTPIHPTRTPTPTTKPTRTPTPSPTPSPTPDLCPDDPYEPNERFEDAAILPPGVTLHAYICPDWDFDLFRFHVSGLQRIELRLDELPRDYQLALFGPDHSVLARAGDAGTDPREIRHDATTPGDYWARVSPGSVGDAGRTYALHLDLSPIASMMLLAVDDSYAIQTDPDSTHGDERRVIVGRDEFGYEQRGYFRFDLSDVPAVPIAAAHLVLNLEGEASGVYPISARRISGAWDEATINWNNKPWSVDAGVSAEVGGVRGHDYAWDVTELTQSWLTGGVGNFGIELRPGPGSASRSFRSSEYGIGMFVALGTGSVRSPRLIIDFETPDPGALGSISGRVFDDANGNDRYDAGEAGIAGARLEISRERMSLGQVTSDAAGVYGVANLSAGDYEVMLDEHSLAAAYRVTGVDTRSVTLAAGENREDVNFNVTRRPTPTPLPDPTLDLIASDIEFIQVVQGAPLIAQKRTLARVYVGVTGATSEVTSVSGRLYNGFDWIEPIARANLLPEAAPMSNPAIVADLDRTLNFLLPESWTAAGRRDFIAWVNYNDPGRECPGCWNAANQYSTWAHGDSPTFHTAEPLEVTMVDVTVDMTSPVASHADTYRWLLQTYPIHEVDADADALTVSGYDFADTSGSGCGTGWGSLLDDLEEVEVFGSAGESSNMKFFGLIDESVPHAFSGCGRRPGEASAGIVNNGTSGRTWVEDSQTMAHEIGHNLGRQHTLCSGREARPDPDYPYPGGEIGVYGVDLADPANPLYLDPTTHHDIMSYCGNRWLSDYTFRALRAAIGAAASVQTQSGPDVVYRDYLMVAGHIVDGQAIVSGPFYQVQRPMGSHDDAGVGPFTLELQDAGGQALFRRYFDVVGDSIDPVAGDGSFRQLVPWQQGTERIVIKQGQQALFTRYVSEHIPEVTVISPNGGEQWAPFSQQTIRWLAHDKDGDSLWFVVQYSPDGGQSWRVLASDRVETSLRLSAATLPGGDEALIRVIASDGVNTARDESDDFSAVDGKPPRAEIIFPLDGDAVQPGGLVLFQGAATDLEDGAISDPTRFSWTSSLEGTLGVGPRLSFDDLQPGWHTITLRVQDSDGYSDEDSVDLFVGQQLYLPLNLKQ